MMLFFKRRHCTYLPSSPNLRNTKNQSSKKFRILQFCKSGALPEALRLLYSIGSGDTTRKPVLYASLLQTCSKVASFRNGLQIHGRVIKSGLETNRFVGNSLLTLYFKLGPDFSETQKVFEGDFSKDLISWTSMISGYRNVGKPESSVKLFVEMFGLGIEPNEFTLSAVIKACSEIGDAKFGQCLHGLIMRLGFDSDIVICNALTDMYGRSCVMEDARKVFDEMPEPDAMCWTSIISACTRSDLFEEALGMFCLMQRRFGLASNGFMLATVLSACGNLGRLKQGKEVHGKVVTSGHCGDVVVESSLVDMYGKCGLANESQRVFDTMRRKNSVSWSALCAAYCQNGDFTNTIKLFRESKEADLNCFVTVLRACSGLAAVKLGKEIHCQYVRRGHQRNIIIESALVNLYAKCGCIDFAIRIFVNMPFRHLISWNTMIHGFAQNGRSEEAIQMFNAMVENGIKPDCVSFIGVLSACSHAGFIDQGKKYFNSMTEQYRVRAGIEHYICMVNLLGRAGLLEEAESLIANADVKDESPLWEALLGACTISTNVSMAERVAKKMMELKPEHHLSYVLLENVYRAAGRWDDALNIRRLMERRRIEKIPGMSWI